MNRERDNVNTSHTPNIHKRSVLCFCVIAAFTLSYSDEAFAQAVFKGPNGDTCTDIQSCYEALKLRFTTVEYPAGTYENCRDNGTNGPVKLSKWNIRAYIECDFVNTGLPNPRNIDYAADFPFFVGEPEQLDPPKCNQTNPCDPATGNKSQKEMDYLSPGNGGPSFTRYYNSQGPYRTGQTMAAGWRHSYSRELNEQTDREPGHVFGSSTRQSALYGTKSEACKQGWGEIKAAAFGGDLSSGTATLVGKNTCAIQSGGSTVAYLPVRSWAGIPKAIDLDVTVVTRPNGGGIRFELVGGVWVNKLNSSLLLEYDMATDTYVFTDANKTKETYNSAGQLITVLYRNGQEETLEYALTVAQGGDDDSATLDRVVGPFGHKISFSYDSDGRLATLVTPDGTFQYNYDAVGNLETVTYPDAALRQYHYEDPNFTDFLTGITDEELNRYATWGYDTQGRAILSEHASGKEQVTLEYDPVGHPSGSTKLTMANGASRIYTYSTEQGRRKLATLSGDVCGTCPGGNVKDRTYDANGFLDEATDWNGRITQTARNSDGLTETLTEAKGTVDERVTSFGWRSDRQLDLVTTAKNVTDYIYYPNGDLDKVTISGGAKSRTWHMTYHANRQLWKIDGPRIDVSDITTFLYHDCTTGNECGQLHTITNALGHVTTYQAYDNAGRPTLIIDPNGLEISLTYDWRGNVLTVTQTPTAGAARTTTMTYYPTGQLWTLSTPDGMVLTYDYYPAHDLKSVTDNHGNRIEYDYDAMGNLSDVDTYDSNSTLQRVLDYHYDLNSRLDTVTNGGYLTDLTFDSVGNLTDEIDPGSATTQHIPDALDRLDKTIDAMMGETDYGYDAHDNITSVTTANNAHTVYFYDELDDLKYEDSPDRGRIDYTYDEAGNLKTQLDARGILTAYEYDALNRLKEVTLDSSPPIVYEYDVGANAIGRIDKITDGSGETSWSYNQFGDVTAKTQKIGTVALTTDYTYEPTDPSGRLKSMTVPSGAVISYGYDVFLPDSVTLGGTTILTGATYEPFGPVNGWTWGNSTTLSRSFDTRGVMDSHTVLTDTWILGFDSAGRVSLVDDSRSVLVPDNETYTYGITANSNRLATISGPTVKTYTYDASGNTTGDGVYTFGYDDRGRLVDVDSGAVTYVHNGQGQRVKKDDGTAETLFVYDEAGHLIGEYDLFGNAILEHVWFNGEPVAVLEGPNAYYVHTDHLGTPRAISDGSTAIWRWDSGPFGTNAAEEDPDENLTGFTYNLRFPGQYYDAETGLHYNYYRTYDPATGRYLESDPIGLAAGLNTYSYVSNMPTMYSDTFGLANDNSIYTGLPAHQADALRKHRSKPRRRRESYNFYTEVGGCAFGVCAESTLWPKRKRSAATGVLIAPELVGGGASFCMEIVPEPESCDSSIEAHSPSVFDQVDETSVGMGRRLGVTVNSNKLCVNIGLGLGSPISPTSSKGEIPVFDPDLPLPEIP